MRTTKLIAWYLVHDTCMSALGHYGKAPYNTAPAALYYADRQGETVEPISVYHKLEISWASDSSRGAVSYTVGVFAPWALSLAPQLTVLTPQLLN